MPANKRYKKTTVDNLNGTLQIKSTKGKKKLQQIVVNEMTNYLLEKPDTQRKELINLFSNRLKVSTRTFDNYIVAARDNVNAIVVNSLQKKQEYFAKKELEKIDEVIITRDEIVRILSTIARGIGRSINGKVIIPTDNDRIQAAKQICKMYGYEAPQRTENINASLDKITIEVIDSREKILPVDVQDVEVITE